MTYEQIMAELKQQKYRPVYFLHGEEPYFIDAISDYIEQHALGEGERAFNQTVLYGKDTTHLMVADCARRYPMMAERQVVIVKEAQDMKSLPELLSYVERPMPTTVLVLCHKYKKLAMTTKLGKLLATKALVYESKALYDNQVPDWIAGYLTGMKLRISPKAAGIVAEYLGTDLAKIANELDKLALNLAPGTEINEKHIEDNIGISKDYNVFELQKAIGQRDVLKANRIVNYFAANPGKNPMVTVVSALFNYFSKVYMFHFVADKPESDILSALGLRSAFFLRDYKAAARNFRVAQTEHIIGILREYDLKSKGVDYNSTGKQDGDLMKEMVWRILH